MCVTLYRDQYHRSLMPIYLPEKSCNMVSGEHTEGNNGSRRCFTLTHPPSQFVFYGQGPNVPLGKPNSKLFVIVPLLSSSSLHTLSSISMCSTGPDVADGERRPRKLFVAVTEQLGKAVAQLGKESKRIATPPAAARPDCSLP